MKPDFLAIRLYRDGHRLRWWRIIEPDKKHFKGVKVGRLELEMYWKKNFTIEMVENGNNKN